MKTLFIILIFLFSKALYAFDNQTIESTSNVFSDVPNNVGTASVMGNHGGEPLVNNYAENDTILNDCEQMPEFMNGGREGLMKFIADSTRYPKGALEKKIQGKVFIRFIVCKDGSIKNPTVVKPLLKSFDEEALRVTRLLPKFKAGKQNGKIVDCWYVVPFEFSLENEKDLKK